MKKIAFAIALLVTSPAFAQEAPDPIKMLGEDFTVFQGSQRHLLESLNKVVEELVAKRKENAELKAEVAKLKTPSEAPKK